jgi:hypothetical protein
MSFLDLDATWRAIMFGALFLVTLAVVLWLYYDSQEGGGEALLWRSIAAIAAALTLPALVVSAFNLDVSHQDIVNPFGWLSVGGTAAALAVTAAYFLRTHSGRRAIVTDSPPGFDAQTTAPPIEDRTTIRNAPAADHTVVLRRGAGTSFGYLLVRSGSRSGQMIKLNDRMVIGRGAAADIRLDDHKLSADHGSIRFEDGAYVYRDHGSTNGSWLITDDGRKKIDNHRLMDRDRLELGETALVFTEVREDGGR